MSYTIEVIDQQTHQFLGYLEAPYDGERLELSGDRAPYGYDRAELDRIEDAVHCRNCSLPMPYDFVGVGQGMLRPWKLNIVPGWQDQRYNIPPNE